jgi:hypothetical protein
MVPVFQLVVFISPFDTEPSDIFEVFGHVRREQELRSMRDMHEPIILGETSRLRKNELKHVTA